MLEGMQRAGADVPALNARPDIGGYEWIWEAFWWLSTCRGSGMSPGQIPWTAIDRYREVEELTPFESLVLFACIGAMDRILLEHGQKARQEMNRPAGKPAAQPTAAGRGKRM